MKARARQVWRAVRVAAVAALILILAASQEARWWALGVAAVAVLGVVVALVRRWASTQADDQRDPRDGDLT